MVKSQHPASKNRRKKKKHPALKLAAALIVVTILFASFILYISSIVNRNVVIEAGAALPAVDEFIRSDKYTGEYLTDLTKIDTAVPGRHDIQVKVRGRSFWVTLQISDTTPPSASPVNNEIWLGDSIEAERFAANPADISSIAYSFKQVPDFTKAGL
ncbi:MAG: hypothetical protein ACYC5K_12620, partial [Saccharofermentanales bacterium]